MSEPISIQINGGSTEERSYVSDVIEGALVVSGFSEIQNKVLDNTEELSDDRNKTLLDYAINKNPDLFTQPIVIADDDEPVFDLEDEGTTSDESYPEEVPED